MVLFKSIIRFLIKLWPFKKKKKGLNYTEQKELEKMQFLKKKYDEALASGCIKCYLCPRVTGIHRITLRKIFMKKLKQEVYLCQICIKQIQDGTHPVLNKNEKKHQENN